jgi:hypothetical protein
MKEKSKELFKKYSDMIERVKNDGDRTNILTLAASMEKDNEITYFILEEIINSVNSLYDDLPTEKQIMSTKTEAKDTTISAPLTSEQLKEIEDREKRANKIYG